MRFLIAMLLLASSTSKADGQESPLDKLTVVTVRLRCKTGFARVTYAYKREVMNAETTKLEFVVIENDKHNSRFKSCFFLSSKVDDVTPPAYLSLGDGVVDLPNKNQIHSVSSGRYSQTDSDISLGEIRRWLNQPQLQANSKSLLEYLKRYRSTKRVGSKQ